MKTITKTLKNPGFTLAELMVGLVMSSIIMTTLLGFMLQIMETDKKEQAKVTSEQEIQAALEYISRDLQQAVYIYDAPGIEAINNQLPSPPNGIDRVPVLVFWQRELIQDVLPILGGGKEDAFAYALVVYFLIKDTRPSASNWSQTARIGKWKIRDGILADKTDNTSISCGLIGKYVRSSGSNPNEYCPSSGFKPFDLNSQGTIAEIMNNWQSSGGYTARTFVLVDYIDQTTNNPPPALCPSNSFDPNITWSKVTPDSFNTTETGRMTSFYACIDSQNTTAQVFIRGNALARVRNKNIDYIEQKETFFPRANIKTQGRGLLYK
ncbi:MAG: prepilin-type N-terminal cleavage/methylation domain-containing protein [Sphaerospermopsis sp. SIO1G2]|nr:prepilin-type N-terminal cleavage/methylation domain-containing protein [Sphaerospermopsis sp. SIO1G2]